MTDLLTPLLQLRPYSAKSNSFENYFLRSLSCLSNSTEHFIQSFIFDLTISIATSTSDTHFLTCAFIPKFAKRWRFLSSPIFNYNNKAPSHPIFLAHASTSLVRNPHSSPSTLCTNLISLLLNPLPLTPTLAPKNQIDS